MLCFELGDLYNLALVLAHTRKTCDRGAVSGGEGLILAHTGKTCDGREVRVKDREEVNVQVPQQYLVLVPLGLLPLGLQLVPGPDWVGSARLNKANPPPKKKLKFLLDI